ncbi:MAG: ubiquitin-like small modifier protein 1 [Halobacteriales archaeon]|nr:ubiquitin-like small modifier protein 1 [Halobacteriales archaeon]
MEWRLFADLAEVADDKHVTVDLDEGQTVEDALTALLDAKPALRERVLDEDGDLQSHINVLKNGTDIENEAGLETTVDDGDELALFPPVSGG